MIVGRCFPSDIETKWNSTRSVSFFINYNEATLAFCDFYHNTYLDFTNYGELKTILNEKDLKEAKFLIQILGPLNYMIKFFFKKESLAGCRHFALLFFERLIFSEHYNDLTSEPYNVNLEKLQSFLNKTWLFEVKSCHSLFLFGLFHPYGKKIQKKYEDMTGKLLPTKCFVTELLSKCLKVQSRKMSQTNCIAFLQMNITYSAEPIASFSLNKKLFPP